MTTTIIEGDTYPHRQTLKGLGAYWNATERRWELDEPTAETAAAVEALGLTVTTLTPPTIVESLDRMLAEDGLKAARWQLIEVLGVPFEISPYMRRRETPLTWPCEIIGRSGGRPPRAVRISSWLRAVRNDDGSWHAILEPVPATQRDNHERVLARLREAGIEIIEEG